MRDFAAFPKIQRLNRALWVSITEKIDGSNAQVVIEDGRVVAVGSRTRWITPGKSTDNFGFAAWVAENEAELVKLGDGTHFGEWYGQGIQCGYGMTGRRFALFNALRWGPVKQAFDDGLTDAFPNCVDVVPVLYSGAFTPACVDDCMRRLATEGSVLVPGFRKPEGIIALMLGTPLKLTFEHTEGKWASELATKEAA